MGIGLANKIVSLFAKKICISWDSSRKYFPEGKVILTGNPIRRLPTFVLPVGGVSIFKNKLPIIYATGGSSGSHFINLLIEEIIEELLKRYNVIHQAGDAHEYHDFDRLKKIKDSLSEKLRDRYILEKFIDPSGIGDLLNLSSLVISRAGINTVTELIYFEKPAILIPLPFAQSGEQLRNARFLEKIGIAVILHQSRASSKKLLKTVRIMIRDIDKYKINEEKFKNLPGKHAAKNIISVINYVYKSKTAKTS